MSDRAVRLSELAQQNWIEVGAGRPRSAGLEEYPLPILRVADVLDGAIDTSLQGAVDIPEGRLSNPKISRPGDVVLTVKGTVGRAAIMTEAAPHFAYSPQLCYFRPSNGGPLISRYLYYWFKSAEFWRQANALKGQTDMADYISLSDIMSLKIVLPDVSEQRAIAEVLGALDDKIASNDRAASLSIELSDVLFSQAVESRCGGSRVTIKQLAEKGLLKFSDGYRTKRAELDAPGLRILRAGDIRDNRVFASGSDFVSEEYRAKIGDKVSAVNDVVITTKGTVGRVAMVLAGFEGNVYSPQLCYLRVSGLDAVAPCYVAAWLRSGDAWAQMSSVMHKSDMAPYINLKDIGALEMPWGDHEFRNELGARLNVLMEYFHALGVENSKLAETRDELLPLLMSGKLRVKDAEKIVEEIA